MANNSTNILKIISDLYAGLGGLHGDDFFNGQASIVEIVLSGNIEALREVLEDEPARINEVCPTYKITPIIAAAGRGMPRATKIILATDGVDLSAIDALGRTAFDHASLFPDILPMLLEHKRQGRRWYERPPSP